jgi:cleavage and polyadenylation specificity factor subunit 1
LGYLLPCSEKTYRRLLMLQNVLVTAIPHTAGKKHSCVTMFERSI